LAYGPAPGPGVITGAFKFAKKRPNYRDFAPRRIQHVACIPRLGGSTIRAVLLAHIFTCMKVVRRVRLRLTL